MFIEAMTQIAVEWGLRCFGVEHMRDKKVRAIRFAEEAIETAQAYGVPQDKVAELVRIVYSRPEGTPIQEIGGSMVTLAVLCHTSGIDLKRAFLLEVLRVLEKSPEHFAKRNQEKIDLGLTGSA